MLLNILKRAGLEYEEGMDITAFIIKNENKLVNALADEYPILYQHLIDVAYKQAKEGTNEH